MYNRLTETLSKSKNKDNAKANPETSKTTNEEKSDTKFDTSNLIKTFTTTTTTTKNSHHFYLHGDIWEGYDWYIPFMNLLNGVGSDIQPNTESEIVIHLNSIGGTVTSAVQILAAIERCPVDVHLKIEGKCASAATVIAFGGRFASLEIARFSSFLFHNGFSFAWGKPSDVKSQSDFHYNNLRTIFEECYEDILTQEEIDDILMNGRELYMSSAKVSARLKQREKNRKKSK